VMDMEDHMKDHIQDTCGCCYNSVPVNIIALIWALSSDKSRRVEKSAGQG